jgi:Zn-dependent protease with chaperone function
MLQQQKQAQLPEDKVPLLVQLGVWIYPVIAGIAFYYGTFQLRHLPIASWSIVFLLGNLALYVSWIAVGWWARAKTSLPLTDEHPMAECSGTLAAKAGRQIKRLFVFPSPKIDAYCTPAGSLYLSSALLRNLTPHEAEATIAHNIHLGSVKWAPILGMASYGILGLFTSTLRDWLYHQFDIALPQAMFYVEATRMLLMLVIVVATIIWNDRRQKAADAFAVKVTGDPERVVQAILKAYFLSPGITQGSMENPPDGIKERIRRIRKM